MGVSRLSVRASVGAQPLRFTCRCNRCLARSRSRSPMDSPRPVVLIVDDEVQIRRFLRAGFEPDHFTVIEAENAQAGLRAATLLPVDLMVLDLGLPDLDGATIVERVRSWSNVPIIVLSVRSSEQEKVRL